MSLPLAFQTIGLRSWRRGPSRCPSPESGERDGCLNQEKFITINAYLLTTESQDEFASLCEELEQEIQPNGVIERTYVQDIAYLIWDIRRLRRSKTAIINTALFAALRGILEQLQIRPATPAPSRREQVEALGRGWFDNEKAKTQVATLLRKFGLDESAIEGEAFRLCAEDIERLDRTLTFAEARRDRALRCIADYRQAFSRRLQQAASRILDSEEVPKLAPVDKQSD
jgi:hypothetical protein